MGQAAKDAAYRARTSHPGYTNEAITDRAISLIGSWGQAAKDAAYRARQEEAAGAGDAAEAAAAAAAAATAGPDLEKWRAAEVRPQRRGGVGGAGGRAVGPGRGGWEDPG